MQGNGVRFQQDNARLHTARMTTAFFQTHNIAVLPWPSKSLGLNPIDNFWDELDRHLRQRQPQQQTGPQLRLALQAEWDNIPQQTIRILTSSMVCRAVINACERHTRY